MLPAPILVVEDDADIAALVQAQLRREGFEVIINADGAGVHAQAAALAPALVILDLMLPRAHGLDILRELRRDPSTSRLPVLVLTALGTEAERVRGLDLGADDYLTKPFSPAELAARVRARLRAAPETPALLTAGALELDLKARQARRAGQVLDLSDTEFRLLAFLLRTPGRAYTRAEIIAAVWAPQHFITERAVDVFIRRLRAKLETELEAGPGAPAHMVSVRIVSVRNVGYRLETA